MLWWPKKIKYRNSSAVKPPVSVFKVVRGKGWKIGKWESKGAKEFV